MRIEFKRSGGFGNIPRSVTWDTDAMSAEDARELTQLVDAASFFNQPQELRSGGADKFQYTIRIDRDGQTHTVQADERALPANLAPLVKKLEAAAGKR